MRPTVSLCCFSFSLGSGNTLAENFLPGWFLLETHADTEWVSFVKRKYNVLIFESAGQRLLLGFHSARLNGQQKETK